MVENFPMIMSLEGKRLCRRRELSAAATLQGKDVGPQCPSRVAESCAARSVLLREWDLVEGTATLCA